MSGSIWHIIAAAFLLATNAFFVAAEFALVKIRQTRLEELKNSGNRLAEVAFTMVENLDNYLSATQLGITFASLGLGYVGEPAFHWLLAPLMESMGPGDPVLSHKVSLTASFIFFSGIHIILGELVPKSLAIQMTEKVVLWVAAPMRVFYMLCFPFLWGLQFFAGLILKVLRLPPAPHGNAATEAELRLIVEDSAESGGITKPKQDMLDRVFTFSDKTIHDVMVPTDKMDCFYLDRPTEENLKLAEESMHTRYPLYEVRGGDVLGFVHIKDIVWNYLSPELINLFDLCRPLIVFDQNKRIDAALKDFRNSKTHLAMVVDAERRTIGFVSLEDVLEELVGEIDDEFDVMGVESQVS